MKKTGFEMGTILDASAWIELFNGSDKGREIDAAVESGNCNTSILTLAEVTNWAIREGREYTLLIDRIERLSCVLYIDRKIAVLAGEIDFQRKKIVKKWGIADSFVLATAISYGLQIITTDSGFNGLPDAKVL
ncbi:MAG: PIN domain-containing protein [Candidatus Micrarchaeales archaeon]